MNFASTNFLGAGNYTPAHTGALFNWTYPNGASPDYFIDDFNCPPIAPGNPVNNFAGCETAHAGNGCVGMHTYSLPSIQDTIPSYREYVQGELTQPLQAGRTYFLSLWVSSADYLRYISRIQVGFYTVAVNINTGLNLALPNANNVIYFDNVVPINQPAYGVNGWTNFTSTYTATGGELYFIVGNYFYDVNPSFPILSSNGIQIQIGNYNYCSG